MSWGCAYPHRGSRDDGCRHRGTARAPMQAPVGFLQQGVGLLLRQLGQRQREVGVGHWGVPQDTTLPGQDPRPGPSPSPLHHRLHHNVAGGRGWHGDAGVGGHQGGLGRGRHLGSRPQARHGGCRPAVPLEGRAQCRWGDHPREAPADPVASLPKDALTPSVVSDSNTSSWRRGRAGGGQLSDGTRDTPSTAAPNAIEGAPPPPPPPAAPPPLNSASIQL